MTKPVPTAGRWLRGNDTGAEVPRLICCPHSGGSASFFRPWQQWAPSEVAVLAVQYPGRHDRLTEPFARSVVEMADAVAAEIGRHSPPLVLFGHSMGASVAFETARRLRAAGVAVAGLIVSSHPAPTVPITSDLHRRGDDEMWRVLAELGGTEAEILELAELREISTPVIRADLTVSAEYLDRDCAQCLDVPVFAVTGTDDVIAPAESMVGWGEVTTDRFELRALAGDHFYLQAHAGRILRLARDLLAADTHAGAVG